MSAAEARQVLRSLLRAVDRNITSATGNTQWRQFVLAEFRHAEALGDPAERERALQDAKDYALLIDSVREHKVGAGRGASGLGGLGTAAAASAACCRCRLLQFSAAAASFLLLHCLVAPVLL